LWIYIIYSKTAAEITNNAFKVFQEWGYLQILHTNNRSEFVVFIEAHQFEEHGIEVHYGALSAHKLKEQLNLCTKLLKVK
jgi:hypothetical protein